MYRETVFLKDPNLYDVRYTGNSNIGSMTALPQSTEDYEEKAKHETRTMTVAKKTHQPLWKGGKMIPKMKKKKK